MRSCWRGRTTASIAQQPPLPRLAGTARPAAATHTGSRCHQHVLHAGDVSMATSMHTSAADEAKWKLWYWPGIKGRGEYVRLMFEEAGVEYDDVGQDHDKGFQAVAEFVFKGGNKHFPLRSPPAIQRGAFVLCGTNVIMSYLNRLWGWGPADEQSRAHIDQILAIVADAVAEGRLAFHPKDFFASHKTQVEESKPYVQQYGEQRLPKYLQHFHAILEFNGGGSPAAPGFLVGDSLTAADLALYHYLAAAQQHYRQYYEAHATPLLRAFAASIASRPRIAAYLASPRCLPWDADSMM